MDSQTRKHLDNWLDDQFHDETERHDADKVLTQLWDSDPEYWTTHDHSWWEMLDIGKRNRADRAARAMKAICKS